MAAVSVRQVSDFTGGLNFRADQFQLADNESPKMLNVEIDPRGGVFSRGAQKFFNAVNISGTWTPHRLFPFYGTTSTLMLAVANKVQRAAGTTFSLLKSDVSTDVVSTCVAGASFAQWGKTVHIAGGTTGGGGYDWLTANTYASLRTASGTAPNDWQVTADAAIFKMPHCELLAVHANKMFAANTTEVGVAYPNRVRWSLENAPANWASADYIDVAGGGDGVTGLAVVDGQLVIFKPRTVYVLLGYDSTSFRVVELSSNVGADTSKCVTQTENGVYFYARNQGIYFYDGARLVNVSENINPIFERGYVAVNVANSTTLSWVGKRLWLSMPYSTTGTAATVPTVNFVYDPTISGGAWVMLQHQDSTGLVGGCDWTNDVKTEYRLMLHNATARVLRVDLYTDTSYDNLAGSDAIFASHYRTKWQDGGSFVRKKMWRRPTFVVKETASTTTIVVTVFHDYAEETGQERRTFNLVQTPNTAFGIWGTGLWGTALWGSSVASSIMKTGSNLGSARTVQLHFGGPTGAAWGLNSIGYKFQNRNTTG